MSTPKANRVTVNVTDQDGTVLNTFDVEGDDSLSASNISVEIEMACDSQPGLTVIDE